MTTPPGPTFDLTTERWIPVLLDSGAVEELSLRQVFARAHEIRDILGEVPTQTFATVRVLLAILHRSLGEADDLFGAWSVLWEAPTLPCDAIGDYLDHFVDRFDLLHPVTPFFQVAALSTENGAVSGLEKLIADVPNGEPFFTTRTSRDFTSISFAESARWLVHCQAFDPSGIKSGAIGDDRVKKGKGYPIGTSWAGALGGILLEGTSLKETLLLNLVLADANGEYVSSKEDIPAWEREPLTAATDPRPIAGQIDLFTWQSRRIRLFHDDTAVTGVLVCNGDPVAQQNQHTVEPMSTWRRSTAQEKARKEVLVYMPRTHDPERAIWRGLAALLPRFTRPQAQRDGAAALTSLTLDWIDRLRLRGLLSDDYVLHTHAIGMAYGSQSSTVAEIVDDSLSIHAILVAEHGRRLAAAAVDAVGATDEAVTAVAMLAGNLAVAAGGEPEGSRNRAREDAYFRLDGPFRSWLSGLTAEIDPPAALAAWRRDARRLLWRYAQDLLGDAGPTAWVGRESMGRHVDTALADVWFRSALAKALPDPDHPTAPDHAEKVVHVRH